MRSVIKEMCLKGTWKSPTIHLVAQFLHKVGYPRSRDSARHITGLNTTPIVFNVTSLQNNMNNGTV
jgi:hypothetical protein